MPSTELSVYRETSPVPVCAQCLHCAHMIQPPRKAPDYVCLAAPKLELVPAHIDYITGEHHAAETEYRSCSKYNSQGECTRFEQRTKALVIVRPKTPVTPPAAAAAAIAGAALLVLLCSFIGMLLL